MSKKHLTIEVLQPGSEVKIGDVACHIAQVCITDALAVTYECVWWSSNERRSAWVSPVQITPGNAKRQTIGFAEGSR